ncbi:MAG: sedoheptulokinase [Eubacteriales bacterium]|jgi:sugar (pentulose or hexulose) kinase
MKYIALDLGTSFVKGAVLDVEQLQIQDVQLVEMPKAVVDGGEVEYVLDFDRFYPLVEELVRRFVSQYASQIAGILISTQMHGIIVADADGNARTPYISWLDNRCLLETPEGGSYLQRLEHMIPREKMKGHGVYLKACMGMCNLYAAQQRGQYLCRKGDVICTIGSLVIKRLTGQYACHKTNAAPIGLYDIQKDGWNEELKEQLGFGVCDTPKAIGEYEIAGYYHADWGEIPVYPDLGDQQVAVIGSMMKAVTEVNFNIATGAQIAYIADRFTQGNFEVRPFLEGLYLNTVTRMPGGRTFDVLLGFLMEVGRCIYGVTLSKRELWDKITQEVAGVKSNSLEVNIGFYKDSLGTSEGSIRNINPYNLTIGNLFDGAYRQAADIFASYYHELIPDDARVEQIVFTGGVAQKDAMLRKLISERVRLPYSLAPAKDEVFLGHLRIALVCAGKCKNLKDTETMVRRSLA